MLICEDISFDIDGHKLFSNVNLNIKSQKDLLITGPSGVGKTTLLSVLCGIQKPTTGCVTYNNVSLYSNKMQELTFLLRVFHFFYTLCIALVRPKTGQ